eukprot:gnl/TRDRNA2_/TRDRNA2_199585_c0_seq1.p1 gnl/TRDRNA2_/TRDRNA2_199585_c0~~gnl/TRDRNA2_/TRDRNA2_199585_c0_seq1.p1  ORF type:complete len:301 (+),score=21.15 gnl/TRDRNA2_/TRDRNA2_199585_c0_seq1:2-904(+)
MASGWRLPLPFCLMLMLDTDARKNANPLASVSFDDVHCSDASSIASALPPPMRSALRSLQLQNTSVSHGRVFGALPCSAPKGVRPKDRSTVWGMAKYWTRAYAGGCANAQGMWNPHTSARLPATSLCQYEAIGELFNLRAGQVVLDWGAGCAHQLDILAAKRGFRAVAIDAVDGNVRWGRSFLQHVRTFCQVDGTRLPFPDNTFDAVLSYAALIHVHDDLQCATLRETILRVLRPGGCAWFGWTGQNLPGQKEEGQTSFPPEFWTGADGCFKGLGNVVAATFWETTVGAPFSIVFCKTFS